MSEMQAQAHTCSFCFDDHQPDRPCRQVDLLQRIHDLKAESQDRLELLNRVQTVMMRTESWSTTPLGVDIHNVLKATRPIEVTEDD